MILSALSLFIIDIQATIGLLEVLIVFSLVNTLNPINVIFGSILGIIILYIIRLNLIFVSIEKRKELIQTCSDYFIAPLIPVITVSFLMSFLGWFIATNIYYLDLIKAFLTIKYINIIPFLITLIVIIAIKNGIKSIEKSATILFIFFIIFALFLIPQVSFNSIKTCELSVNNIITCCGLFIAAFITSSSTVGEFYKFTKSKKVAFKSSISASSLLLAVIFISVLITTGIADNGINDLINLYNNNYWKVYILFIATTAIISINAYNLYIAGNFLNKLNFSHFSYLSNIILSGITLSFISIYPFKSGGLEIISFMNGMLVSLVFTVSSSHLFKINSKSKYYKQINSGIFIILSIISLLNYGNVKTITSMPILDILIAVILLRCFQKIVYKIKQ